MRHYYFRLIIGIVWLFCAVLSGITLNIPFLILYIILGVRFLYSAYTIRKKNKDNWG